MVNVEMTNAPPLNNFIQNTEMPNAPPLNNNTLRAAAKKAENNARAEAVRQSRDAAAAARKAAANKAAANKARKNREAAENARKAAEKARKNREAAAKKAAENARKAAENAEKAAEKARKNREAAKNIKKNLNALSNIKTITKERKLAQGKKIYRGAILKLHPNKGGTNEAFQILSSAYNNFEKKVSQN
jgi:hypothetical protein